MFVAPRNHHFIQISVSSHIIFTNIYKRKSVICRGLPFMAYPVPGIEHFAFSMWIFAERVLRITRGYVANAIQYQKKKYNSATIWMILSSTDTTAVHKLPLETIRNVSKASNSSRSVRTHKEIVSCFWLIRRIKREILSWPHDWWLGHTVRVTRCSTTLAMNSECTANTLRHPAHICWNNLLRRSNPIYSRAGQNLGGDWEDSTRKYEFRTTLIYTKFINVLCVRVRASTCASVIVVFYCYLGTTTGRSYHVW